MKPFFNYRTLRFYWAFIPLCWLTLAQEVVQEPGEAENKRDAVATPRILLLRPPSGSDPGAFWNLVSWDDMGNVEQDLWSRLGWGKESWNGQRSRKAIYPPSRDRDWNELSPAEREAATQLGFSEITWSTRQPGLPKALWLDPRKPAGALYRTFHSKTISGLVSYLIYLPEEYDRFPERRYPVVYTLPGGLGTPVLPGFVNHLKPAVAAGQSQPTIVVGVNIGMAGSMYRDPPRGEVPIESVIIKELVPHIDETYRTIARRGGRGLYGASMGGFGALYLGLKYPEMFCVISSACPSVVFAGVESPWKYAAENASTISGRVRIQLSCGTEDGLLPFVKAYHELLLRLDIAHEYLEVEGANHSDLNTKLGWPKVLDIFGQAFRDSSKVNMATTGTGIKPPVREIVLLRPATGSDPDTFWQRMGWKDLYSVERQLWGILGLNETNWYNQWNRGISENFPESRGKNWQELSTAEQAAACELGYGAESWRARPAWRGSPASAQNTAATWVDPIQDEPEGAKYKTFQSQTLGEAVSYLIHLPETYDSSSDKRYPVIYCLPGDGEDQRVLRHFVAKLKPLVKAGKASPVIVVGVNAVGLVEGFYQRRRGEAPIEDVIINDLIPHIDQTYRTINRREGRALEGAWMGGLAALYYGIKYSEIFGAISSLSPQIRINSPWRLTAQNADLLRGQTRIRLTYSANDGTLLLKAYHELLDRLNLPHDFVEFPGANNSYEAIYSRLNDLQAVGFFEDAFRNLQ